MGCPPDHPGPPAGAGHQPGAPGHVCTGLDSQSAFFDGTSPGSPGQGCRVQFAVQFNSARRPYGALARCGPVARIGGHPNRGSMVDQRWVLGRIRDTMCRIVSADPNRTNIPKLYPSMAESSVSTARHT